MDRGPLAHQTDLRKERGAAGIATVKARGKRTDPKFIVVDERARLIRELDSEGMPQAQIVRALAIKQATLYTPPPPSLSMLATHLSTRG